MQYDIAALTERLITTTDIAEGFRDILSLSDLTDEVRDKIATQLTLLEHRKFLIRESISQLSMLEQHGYPDIPTVEFLAEGWANLEDQSRTIALARNFTRLADGATRVDASVSEPRISPNA